MEIGKWVLTEAGRSADGHLLYTAVCSKCGYKRTTTKLSNLKRTAFKECNHPVKRNWPTTRLGKTYRNMLDRCHNEKAKDYRFYGGLGIRVCDEWREDPHNFIVWAMDNGYNDSMTIDRIDPHKDYAPDNCRWLPAKDNSKYKSTTRLLTIDGETDSLSGWAKRLNIPKTTLVGAVKNKTDKEAMDYIRNILG